jgi:phosphohistidine phosphatase
MKRLTLIRHAKSSWKDETLADHERPLSKRGERDAPRMGKRLKARGARPTLIVSSPAERAKRTAQIIADCLGYPSEFLEYEPALYLASPETLLGTAAAQDDRHADIVLVAHNPGLLELTRRLLPGWPHGNLPTTGIVAVEFDTDRWDEIQSTPARCVFYDYPKNPEAARPR